MAAHLEEVPDKPFYKVGEVCQYTDTQPYVLRFWESEFPQLASEKNRSGQRVYRREDIDLIFRIKKLLNDEEYTIAGARRRLEAEISGQVPADQPGDRSPGPAATVVAERLADDVPAAHAVPSVDTALPVMTPEPSTAKNREDRRLPLDELLPDDPVVDRAIPAVKKVAESPTAVAAHVEEAMEVLRREVHDLRAALTRAEKNLGEAEEGRLAAEHGRLAADEARRTAEDQRDALRARLKRAAARVSEAMERLGPEEAAS